MDTTIIKLTLLILRKILFEKFYSADINSFITKNKTSTKYLSEMKHLQITK